MRQPGWLSFRGEVVQRAFLLDVCLDQMVKAIRRLPGLLASVSLPEASVLSLPEACAPACLLDRAKLPALLRPEPLDVRQLRGAGCLRHEPHLQSGEECSWDSPF